MDTATACLSATPDQGLLGHAVGRINSGLKSFNYGFRNQTEEPASTADGRLKGLLEDLFVW